MAKTMDNLTRDSCAALAAGMSYGKYMAAKHAAPQLPAKELPGVNPTELTGQQARPFCVRCGNPIPLKSRQRLYCGDACRKLGTSERAREKYLIRTGSQGPKLSTCPVCGKEYMMTDLRRTTCSPICSKVARSERVKRYQEQKRKGEC